VPPHGNPAPARGRRACASRRLLRAGRCVGGAVGKSGLRAIGIGPRVHRSPARVGRRCRIARQRAPVDARAAGGVPRPGELRGIVAVVRVGDARAARRAGAPPAARHRRASATGRILPALAIERVAVAVMVVMVFAGEDEGRRRNQDKHRKPSIHALTLRRVSRCARAQPRRSLGRNSARERLPRMVQRARIVAEIGVHPRHFGTSRVERDARRGNGPTAAESRAFSSVFAGGGEGIRTPGQLAPSADFKSAAFDHSATPPVGRHPRASASPMERSPSVPATPSPCRGTGGSAFA
jgi:hypothetical protein